MNEKEKEEEAKPGTEQVAAKPSPDAGQEHPDGVLSDEDLGKVSGGAETVHLYLKASGTDISKR